MVGSVRRNAKEGLNNSMRSASDAAGLLVTCRSAESIRSIARSMPLWARRPRGARPCRALRTHSSPGSHHLPPHHPQVRQREQRDDLRRVLGQPSVADLRVAELPLEYAKRMLDLGPHTGLPLLQALRLEVRRDERVELAPQSRPHGHVPLQPWASMRLCTPW